MEMSERCLLVEQWQLTDEMQNYQPAQFARQQFAPQCWSAAQNGQARATQPTACIAMAHSHARHHSTGREVLRMLAASSLITRFHCQTFRHTAAALQAQRTQAGLAHAPACADMVHHPFCEHYLERHRAVRTTRPFVTQYQHRSLSMLMRQVPLPVVGWCTSRGGSTSWGGTGQCPPRSLLQCCRTHLHAGPGHGSSCVMHPVQHIALVSLVFAGERMRREWRG